MAIDPELLAMEIDPALQSPVNGGGGGGSDIDAEGSDEDAEGEAVDDELGFQLWNMPLVSRTEQDNGRG